MIFVTLGTQDKPFKRLLEEIDKCILKGIIKDKVIVQAGCTKIVTKRMTLFNQIEYDKFIEYIKNCDLLITHGGVGSIIDGLKYNKKIIAIPRLAKYEEAANDHQTQIIENFSKEGYIIGIKDPKYLNEGLNSIKGFKPKKYISNNELFVKDLISYIDKN